jgi:hypothetical protein
LSKVKHKETFEVARENYNKYKVAFKDYQQISQQQPHTPERERERERERVRERGDISQVLKRKLGAVVWVYNFSY